MMAESTDTLGNDVGGLEKGIVLLFGQDVQGMEQRSHDIPVIDMRLDQQSIGVHQYLGQSVGNLLPLGIGEADIHPVGMYLGFQNLGSLRHVSKLLSSLRCR